MRHTLYEMRTYRERVFNRDTAIINYRQIMKSRKVFALAVNIMLEGKPKGRGYAPPQAAQALVDYLKYWKREYNQMHDIPTEMTVRRRYHGQTIEVEVRRRVTKQCNITGRPLEARFTMGDKLHAIKEAMERIRQVRRREKHIDWTSEILCKIANRKPNGLLQEFNGKRLRLPKRPTDGADYVGVEIECIMPGGIDLAPLYPLAKYIEVGGDGSIGHKGSEDGIEIKVCVKREEVREVLPRIMETLKDMGARVNKSCGLHVHLDQRNNLEPDKSFQRLVRSLGLLYTVVPESRRRNRYCKRNRSADFPAAVRGDRYKAINASAFHKYQTIEVRLFGGTLEAVKVINWIEVLLAIAYGETVMRCPKTLDTALRYWKFSEENLAWLKERQTKFSSINAGMPVSEHETEPNQALLDETQPDPDEEETCGECENALDDCSCPSECGCGDCEECNERQEEEERASRARTERRRVAEAQEAERQRAGEIQRRQGVQMPPMSENLIMPIDMSSYQLWISNNSNDVPPPVLDYSTMQRAVDQLANHHIQSIDENINIHMFNQEYGAEFIGVDPVVSPPVEPTPETPPESNGEVPF